MKMMRCVGISLVMILLSASLIHGQDLSTYRNFSFRMSLADLSTQIAERPAEATMIRQWPALIQELKWWPPQSHESAPRDESVQEIVFSFYNGELYRIVVTYGNSATEGLTDEDIVQAISAKYGTVTRPVAEINFPSNQTYGTTERVIARWEDPQYSFNLFRSPFSNSFGLVMFTKRQDVQAAAAIAQAVKVEQQEAPQKEVTRQKKETGNPEVARLMNRQTFRP